MDIVQHFDQPNSVTGRQLVLGLDRSRGFSYSRDSEDLDAPDFVPAGYTTRNSYEGVTYAIGAIVNR